MPRNVWATDDVDEDSEVVLPDKAAGGAARGARGGGPREIIAEASAQGDDDKDLLPMGPMGQQGPRPPGNNNVVWSGGAEGQEQLERFIAPVPSPCTVWVQRSDKCKCVTMYDQETGTFLACARLITSFRRDKCWRFYKSPQAIACSAKQLTKDKRLGYFAKLEWGSNIPLFQKLSLYDTRGPWPVTGKAPIMMVTLNKYIERENTVGKWKVRIAQAPGVIFRCPAPDWNMDRKRFIVPGMEMRCVGSVKNVSL
jgi:hypothetical protein